MNIFKGVKILFKLTSSFHRLLQKKRSPVFPIKSVRGKEMWQTCKREKVNGAFPR